MQMLCENADGMIQRVPDPTMVAAINTFEPNRDRPHLPFGENFVIFQFRRHLLHILQHGITKAR